MKIAISTLACEGWSLEKALEICGKYGIDALEMRMGIHEWSRETLDDREFEQMYEKIRGAGLQVSDLATGVVVEGNDKKALRDIERSAQIACIWKCQGLRIMLGHFITRWSDPKQELNYEGIIQWMQAADLIMERYGTQIWIETHNEFATAKSLMNLLNHSGVQNYRLIWDIMHPLEAGEEPETTLRLMGDMLVHVHIKDGMPWADQDMVNYRYTKLGEGSIPIPYIIQLLKEYGYKGYYSLEWEGIWRKELRGEGFEAEDAIRKYAEMMGKLDKNH